MKRFLDKLVRLPFWYHLLFAVILSCILLVLTLKWLEVYTRHNQAVIVPDVKGLSVERAESFLKKSGLRYSVIDSVFSKEAAPGAIVEITPTAGSKVKEGRIIFVTVNAQTAQMASVPEVADLSLRQAYALLRARGFENVETKYVDGEYKDLALRVESIGRTLNVNEMIPLNSSIVLIVSNGYTESFREDSLEFDEIDSIPVESIAPARPVEPVDNDDENWF